MVLTRRNHEALVVVGSLAMEELLKVMVLEIRRGSVVLGIEGDGEILVYRSELWKRLRAQKGACEMFCYRVIRSLGWRKEMIET